MKADVGKFTIRAIQAVLVLLATLLVAQFVAGDRVKDKFSKLPGYTKTSGGGYQVALDECDFETGSGQVNVPCPLSGGDLGLIPLTEAELSTLITEQHESLKGYAAQMATYYGCGGQASSWGDVAPTLHRFTYRVTGNALCERNACRAFYRDRSHRYYVQVLQEGIRDQPRRIKFEAHRPPVKCAGGRP